MIRYKPLEASFRELEWNMPFFYRRVVPKTRARCVWSSALNGQRRPRRYRDPLSSLSIDREEAEKRPLNEEPLPTPELPPWCSPAVIEVAAGSNPPLGGTS
jgi:hypothetical protein